MTESERAELQEIWEGKSDVELDAESDLEVRVALQKVFGLGSVVYFMSKAEKMAFISSPDQRTEILDVANEKYARHRTKNREARKDGRTLAEKLAEATEGRSYVFAGVRTPPTPAEDIFTGRLLKKVYVIEDVGDGTEFFVGRGTAAALVEAGQLSGFDPSTAARKPKPAHEAGEITYADVFAQGLAESAPEAVPALEDPPFEIDLDLGDLAPAPAPEDAASAPAEAVTADGDDWAWDDDAALDSMLDALN